MALKRLTRVKKVIFFKSNDFDSPSGVTPKPIKNEIGGETTSGFPWPSASGAVHR
jgi:hypothetical protein